MNLSWSNSVIKYVLFIFNLLFVISGIIMIAVGASVKGFYSDYDIFLNNSYFSLPNLLIAIGSLIFFISFFGCCGAYKESWFMVFIFSILLSIIFIMEFSAGIAGYVLRDKTTSYLTDTMLKSMAQYNYSTSENNDIANAAVTSTWDTIQSEFQCCGANTPNDWKVPSPSPPPNEPSSTEASLHTETSATETSPPETASAESNSDLNKEPEGPAGSRRRRQAEGPVVYYPVSCCKSKPGTSAAFHCSSNSTDADVHPKGCVVAFGDYLKGHAVTLGGVGLAIGFIQLFGVVFACHLAKQLKHGFQST